MYFKIGQKVKWRAAGKVSRCDEVAGTLVTGTVEQVYPISRDLVVRKDYDSLCKCGIIRFDQASPM